MRACLALLLALAALEARAQEAFTEAEAGFSSEHLSNGRGEWRSRYLEGAHQFAPRQTLYGSVRETDRFGLRDRELGIGYYHPLSKQWTALVEGSYSPQHNVLPRESVFGQLAWSGPDGWVASGGLRRSEYTLSNVSLLVAGIERYWGSFRAGYTLYNGRPDGAGSGSAHRLALDHYYSERSRIGISVAAGREVENVGPPLGVASADVRNVTLAGRHWIDSTWALTWELGEQRQGDLYRRQGVRIGLRYRF